MRGAYSVIGSDGAGVVRAGAVDESGLRWTATAGGDARAAAPAECADTVWLHVPASIAARGTRAAFGLDAAALVA